MTIGMTIDTVDGFIVDTRNRSDGSEISAVVGLRSLWLDWITEFERVGGRVGGRRLLMLLVVVGHFV